MPAGPSSAVAISSRPVVLTLICSLSPFPVVLSKTSSSAVLFPHGVQTAVQLQGAAAQM